MMLQSLAFAAETYELDCVGDGMRIRHVPWSALIVFSVILHMIVAAVSTAEFGIDVIEHNSRYLSLRLYLLDGASDNITRRVVPA